MGMLAGVLFSSVKSATLYPTRTFLKHTTFQGGCQGERGGKGQLSPKLDIEAHGFGFSTSLLTVSMSLPILT